MSYPSEHENQEFNQEELDAEGVDRTEYTKGYERAFVIADHDAAVAKELLRDMTPDSDMTQGLYLGLRSFFREKEQDRMDDLDALRTSGRDTSRAR